MRTDELFMEIMYPCARGAGTKAASSPSKARRWIPSVEHASSSGATRPGMPRAPQWVHALMFYLLMSDARLPAVHEAAPLEGEGNSQLVGALSNDPQDGQLSLCCSHY